MALTDSKLIIITGASRSGTTLLSFILRNNSMVFGLKELHYFGDIWHPAELPERASVKKLIAAATAIFARQQFGVMAEKTSEEARKQAEALVMSLHEDDQNYAGVFMAAVNQLSLQAGKPIPCIQTPRDIFYAETLLKIFPRAHVVHLLRDPRGVMASQKRRWQRRNLAAVKSNVPLGQTLRVWVNFHPYTVARLWQNATRVARSLQGHERFTLIRFEDLLRDAENVLPNLCERLGLRFDAQMLNVSQINSSHQSSARGAQPGLNTQAIDAWRGILTPAELAMTEELLRDEMRELGYIAVAPAPPSGLVNLRYRLSYCFHLAGVILVNPHRAWIQFRAMFSSETVGSSVR